MEIFTVLKNFSVQVNWTKEKMDGWMEQIMDVVCSMGQKVDRVCSEENLIRS